MAQRYTTHKERADWFQQRSSYPKRESCAQLSQPARAPGPVWTEIGPPDSGGRLTSLAVDPSNPDNVFAGSAGGGVWHTTDAGQHWLPVWDQHSPSLAIGALAIDPHNPKIVYAGTGEANLSGDNYAGAGLFLSTDAGVTWALAGDVADRFVERTFHGATEKFLAVGLPRRIGTIAIDPFDSNHIFLGGVAHDENEVAALFETRDGGKNWDQASDAHGPVLFDGATQKNTFISPLNYFCHAVVFHPSQKDLIFTAVEARGTQSGIWRSEDGGKSWTHASFGLPSGDQFGRTSFAMAAGSKTIYALAGQQGTNRLLGVFRSDDLGNTWTRCGAGDFANENQFSYNNCIAVDPQDPMTVVLGTLELHRSTDGGQTWSQITKGMNSLSRAYVHRDHHALWIGAGRIYSANDGGFFVSLNGGSTWEKRNQGLAISMLYDVAVAPTNSAVMGFGTQDNGTWVVGVLDRQKGTKPPPAGFRPEVPGDGGWTCFDPDDEKHLYASQQRMELWRHRASDGWKNLDLSMIPDAERRLVWMAVVAMDRSQSGQPRTAPRPIYIGSNRLWLSLDDGDTWQPVSDVFDGSVITAVEVAPADPQFIYVGTENGGLFRTKDAGATWSRNLAGPESPGRVVTRIATAPGNHHQAFYTVGVMADQYFPGEALSQATNRILRFGLTFHSPDGKQAFASFRHVYGTRDAGDTWFDADEGSLPNLPHNAIAATRNGDLLVAHEGGVAGIGSSLFRALFWKDISGNLPNIRITDLIYHEREQLVVVSTYGRGAWKVSIDELKRWVNSGQAASPPVNRP